MHRLPKTNANVSIQISGRKITVHLPKNEVDTKFLLSFRYSRWDRKQFCWVIPNYPGNIDLLKEYFKERISAIVTNEVLTVIGIIDDHRSIEKNDLLIIRTKAGRLKLYYGFNKELTYAVKGSLQQLESAAQMLEHSICRKIPDGNKKNRQHSKP